MWYTHIMTNFFKHIHAPDFLHEEYIDYITTEPFSKQDISGNIIILDFWTYCCINCIRTIPDLRELEERFNDDPVQFIGVHSAKFSNENNNENVLQAVRRYEISHPVILDKNRQVWDAFAVNAWPTLIVIDAGGFIRKIYTGEGHKDELEKDIRSLLHEGEKQHLIKLKFSPIQTLTIEKPYLYYPGKIAIENDKIVIANTNNNSILVGKLEEECIRISDKIGSMVAGKDNGDFSNASFDHPQGVALVGDLIYVADTQNGILRSVNLKTKQVNTINTPELRSVWDVVHIDGILYLALAGTHQIGKYNLIEKKYEIFAGNRYENIVDGLALQASFAQPSGLSIQDSILFVADSETSSIRTISLNPPYQVATVVGDGLFVFGFADGNVYEALFQHPLGVAVHQGIVYVADTYNNAIRTINLADGLVATLLHKGEGNVCYIDSKSCDILPLYEPSDVVYYNNKLIISDTNNHLIRKFDLDTKELVTLDIIHDHAAA